MEESEKRKERLRTMRMEASRAQSSAAGTPGGMDHLANPLIETAAVNFTHQESRVAALPRFDYYTDPMGAYSGPRISQPNHSLTHQSQTSLPANSGMYQPVPPQGFTHHPSPSAPNSPFQMHRGMPPQSWNASGQSTTHFSLPNHRGRGSPYPFGSSGRGGNQRFDRSPHPGRSGGRSLDYRGRGSSPGERSGPKWFYHESMVQDPWKGLTPVLWKAVDSPTTWSNAPESSSSWIPKSIQTKKPRVAETPQKFDSGANLAEFLAAAFNESANDPADP